MLELVAGSHPSRCYSGPISTKRCKNAERLRVRDIVQKSCIIISWLPVVCCPSVSSSRGIAYIHAAFISDILELVIPCTKTLHRKVSPAPLLLFSSFVGNGWDRQDGYYITRSSVYLPRGCKPFRIILQRKCEGQSGFEYFTSRGETENALCLNEFSCGKPQCFWYSLGFKIL